MVPRPSSSFSILLVLAIVLLARPTHAFGAGNIGATSSIEGSNWRHGDIDDVLLSLATARVLGGKKFSKIDVKRVYLGSWLRDYSQAIDVGTVKHVSAEAIRLLLWVLSFMSFGYGTKEFEVTRDRLGCYRPEEHIDNPKDYADNIDATQYDHRLRGPVDERTELGIDQTTGLKNYIASGDLGIATSSALVRDLLGQSIELGRQYAHSKDEAQFHDALRLLGTALHCLEDYSAHSNYVELALIELGEHNVFPHVGRNTQIQLPDAQSPVYPIVTGTFGGVDFLHSVMGEFSDKATQSEVQELEGTIAQSKHQDTSFLKELLNKLPSGILGGEDHAGKADQLEAESQAAQMQNMHISPKQPEAFTQQVGQLSRQIYPILEFHDNLIKRISEAIEKIPILPDLIEQLQEQINIFVFSLIAPFILPIINQVKTELRTGSSEVIQSSKDKQLIVFNDDSSTDPTHSMLSKDHFSNVLNEPAGKVACATVAWVVPQIVGCWDDPDLDAQRTTDRIVNGVFHHPALREGGEDGARDGRATMFEVVEKWWSELPEQQRGMLRMKVSREGVQQGRNHKEGVHDSGHGCGKPLGMPTIGTALSSGAIGGVGGAALLGGISSALGSGAASSTFSGSGGLTSLAGGLAGGTGGSLLGSAFEDNQSENKHYQSSHHNQDGSVTHQQTDIGHRPGNHRQDERFGQAQMSQTQYPSGAHREEYQRYEQDGHGGHTGYGFQQSHEASSTQDGGFEQRVERRHERPNGQWHSTMQTQHVSASGQQFVHEERRHGRRGSSGSRDSSAESRSGDDEATKMRRRQRRQGRGGPRGGGMGSPQRGNRHSPERRHGGGGMGSPQRGHRQSPERHHGGGGGGNHGHSDGGGGFMSGFGDILGSLAGGGGRGGTGHGHGGRGGQGFGGGRGRGGGGGGRRH